ncbi:MAG: hypothetical protein BJ554DRAFT_3864 [Olpidium bornovanus]|uniref:Uncharacterized protein n=1 Tax=Olpidium bornovanus TaxID=278681 RepID=A0A8H7ZNN4_9FUNG|nr:MAG: hypothetical protein BJ554DRAFT_3864 [Olpidium bornovanus]
MGTQDFRAKGGSCDVQEVLSERDGVLSIVFCRCLQGFQRDCTSSTVPFDNDLRVNLLVDQLFRFPKQLGSQHADGRGAIADFVVLYFRDIDKNLGGRVVECDGLQNRGAVVRHHNLPSARGLQNFILDAQQDRFNIRKKPDPRSTVAYGDGTNGACLEARITRLLERSGYRFGHLRTESANQAGVLATFFRCLMLEDLYWCERLRKTTSAKVELLSRANAKVFRAQGS